MSEQIKANSRVSWIQSPEGKAKYEEWLQLPITRMVLDQVRMEGRPRLQVPGTMRGEVSVQLYGETCGWHASLDRIEGLNEPTQAVEPEHPAYGEEEILRREQTRIDKGPST